MYDSSEETKKHIDRVNKLIDVFTSHLKWQVSHHDSSKLKSPEKPIFDEMTPKLKGCTYGSPEYAEFLKRLAPALSHHYDTNSHHPEHYPDGISGMTLFDLVEMFADWKAASERHADGKFQRSIEINTTRFNMDKQLVSIFENTRRKMDL